MSNTSHTDEFPPTAALRGRFATAGKDAAKRVPGRKRGLAVDVLGLIIAVVVTAASVTDNAIGVKLLDKVVAHTPTVSKAFVDSGFKDDVAIHGALLGIDVEQVKRSDTTPGFVPVKRRWVVEQVNGSGGPAPRRCVLGRSRYTQCAFGRWGTPKENRLLK